MTNSMWGGRFDKSPAFLMQKINASISFDKTLYHEDITGSLAHAKMLEKQGIISTDDFHKIHTGLKQILGEIESGEFVFKTELEDIHMNVESRLKEIIGEVAGKLHTARSRNDQVATDFKLFVRRAALELIDLIKGLQKSLLILAKEHINTLMPGFTHLQVAQPISFAFYLHAYYEMLYRDRKRLLNLIENANECPLGACALAGTPHNINRFITAETLGFTGGPTKNALDSVSDRDFAIEYLSAVSILAMHYSRFAEEIIIYSSQPFSFIKVPEEYTSGSSIMPQKRNPDAAELIRAKSGRIFGDLFGLLTVMKGLPLAYSKDMQEDKERVFDAFDAIMLASATLDEMVKGLIINKDAMKKALEKGYPTATDLADWLVKNAGIPFREAHHITGTIVKMAEHKGCSLSELSILEMQTIEPKINSEVYKALDVINSLNSRNSYGGTSPCMVEKQIDDALHLFD